MTPEEKQILLKEIPKYIKENCYYTDGSIKYNDLWLVGWVAAEFHDRKNAMRVLISNEYGLLGNLLNKLARSPDDTITRFIEQCDLKVLIEAVHKGGRGILRKNEMTADPYAMRLLIGHDATYAREISGEALKSKEFLLAIARVYPEVLQGVFAKMFDDEKFALSLVKVNHACLKYLPRRFHSNYEMCFEAARQEGYSLMYIDVSILKKDEIVLAAVSNRGNALSLATARQKGNRDIVRAAVENCGLALDYADGTLKRDYEIVSRAVANKGMALSYAAPELRDCEEIVRIAVENDGYAIRSASERLRDNYDLAITAINTYADAYMYLSPRLQSNPEIIKLYAEKKEGEGKWLPSKMQ